MDDPKTPNRILIADDNEANRELLEAYLIDLECETEIAVDGQETICLLYTSPSPRDKRQSRMPSSA